MKKIFCCSILVFTFSSMVIAQKLDTAKIRANGPVLKNADISARLITTVTDIKVYDQPNYKGRSGNFTIVNGKLTAPFPIRNVSFTVPNGKIVYIKKCDIEFPYETAYTASQGKVDLTGICGIRSDDLSGITVQFNGISTVIHNNDCRRVFGDIKIKVFELAPGDGAQSFMNSSAGTHFRGPDVYTFLPFRNASASTTPPYGNYVHNANPSVPTVTTIVSGSGGVGEALGTFRVGASALREGRVSILVTSNLGSAHKTCDLCDDFSSNVRMSAPATESVPLNKPYSGGRIVDASHNRVVLGPYHAHGSRDGFAVTASGGTDKDFRVHLTVTGL
ncbi:MAG: hypothetical protein ABL876_00585 [Chitinophagaceae bacterium]